jgi:hypothetical protein
MAEADNANGHRVGRWEATVERLHREDTRVLLCVTTKLQLLLGPAHTIPSLGVFSSGIVQLSIAHTRLAGGAKGRHAIG